MLTLKVRLLSTSTLAVSLALAGTAAQASTTPTISTDNDTIVVDGNGGTGYTLTTAITASSANPNVINSSSSNPVITVSGTNVTVGSSTTNTLFTNFNTVGGSGSGGGAGLGGVFFVDSGENLTLTNVSFTSNVVQGGTGGVSTTGGSMNGLTTTAIGSSGAAGADAASNFAYLNSGDGGDGYTGHNGSTATNAVGGTGGKGGNGSDGSTVTNDTVMGAAQTIWDAAWAAKDIYDASDYTAAAASFTALAAAAAAGVNAGGPTTAQLAAQFTALATLFTEMAAAEGAQEIIDATWLAAQTAWTTAVTIDSYVVGSAGNGGGGGTGGNGANGSGFFGGGTGGNGGNGGDAAGSGGAVGGSGGDGGTGGNGAFGAGGGSGGTAGTGGTSASGSNVSGSDGSDGSGGTGGFGAGVGSTGTEDNGDGTYGSGGGGGSGYGGAIFVRSGGSLTVTGNSTFSDNATEAGSSENGGAAGDSSGSDIFMMKGSTVTLAPGVGNTITFYGTIADDSSSSIANASYAAGNGASIIITGGGTVQFFNSNTYSGTTYINGATLEADNGVGINTLSHVAFNGTGSINNGLSTTNAGVWLTSGTLVRRVGTLDTQISWGGSGGFAATADGLTLNFGSINGGLGQTLTWGSGSFVPVGSTLIFGSDAVDATGVVTLKNNINLNGNQGQIAVYDNAASTDYANISGNITNGTLLVGDVGYSGTLYLTGQNTLTGLTVQNGTVSTLLGSTVGTLMNSTLGGYLTITGGQVILGGAEKLTSVNLSSGTQLTAYGALTTNDITNVGTIIAKSTLAAGTIANSGSMSVDGAVTSAAITNSGTLEFGANATTGAITNSGTFDVTGALSTGTATIGNTGSLTVGGNLTSGAISNDGLLVVDGTASTGSVGNTGTFAVQGNATTGALTNSGTMLFDAALTSGSVTNSNAFTVIGNASTGAIDNSATGNVSIGGTLTTNGATVGNAGTMLVTGNAATGNVTNSGTLTLASTAQLGTLTNSGTAYLDGATTSNTVANTGTLVQNASLGVTGSATNSNGAVWALGGDLTTSGTVTNDGTMWVLGDSNDTVATTRTITTTGFGGASTGYVGLGGTSGTLANTLVIDQSGNSTYAGVFSGAGSLVKEGAGTLNLTGASDFTGGLTVAAGTLDTTGGGTLADTLAIGVDQGATLIMGTSDLVGSITNAGTLLATADLGLTTLTNSGTATIEALLQASGDVINQLGGELSFVSTANAQVAGNLSNAGTFTSAGTLVVDGTLSNASGATATLASGSQTTLGALTNDGTLTADGSLGVSGAVTNTGTMYLNAGSTPNFGSFDNSGTATVDDALTVVNAAVNSGTLTLSGNANASLGSLDNSGTMTAGGTLYVAGVLANSGTLSVAGATQAASLDNSGTMTAGSTLYVEGDATNSGTLDVTGDTRLGSLTNSGSVNVGGYLTVVGALTQNAGTLTVGTGLYSNSLSGTGGSIDLSGSTYTLNQTTNGTYSGSIVGGGTVDKYGTGTLTLNGAADSFAASYLNIYQGGVTVTTANLLDSALDVLIDTNGTLTLGANQTIHDLTGTGTLNIGTSTLTLADGGDFSGTVNGTGAISVASGDLTLNSTINNTGGSFTVDNSSNVTVGTTGSITTTNLNVTGGTLNLVGTATATTTTLSDGGTLHLGNGVDIDQSGTEVGTLNSTTTYVTGGSSITGNGSVSGTTYVGGTSAGTIAPGNSPGVLSFTNLVFGNNATAAMQVDGTAGAGVTGGNDLIIVTGSLTLGGSSTLAISKSVSNSFELGLGQGVQLFKFAEGKVSGYFGSVTLSDYTKSAIYNVATGTLIGLGNYTQQSFVSAVSTTANQAALMKALMVNNSGGVAQYYGGNLMSYVTNALAVSNAAVSGVFARWSPEAYAGITDQMKFATLDNLPELGGYDKLTPGRTYATGGFNRNGMAGQNVAGYAQNRFRDDAVNLGIAHQFAFGQITLSYGHSDGNFYGANISGRTLGNQGGLGVSVPVAFGQALRMTARVMYGDYTNKGTRSTNSGSANFSGVKSNIFTYGAGVEYLKQSGPLRFDGTAEFLGMHERMSGFGEYGNADTLDLMSVQRMTHDAYVGRLSGTVGYTVTPVVELYANGTYDHEFGRTLTDITAHVGVESTSFTVANTGLARDRFNVSGGVKLNVARQLQVNLNGGAGTNASYRFGGSVRLGF